MRVSHVSQAGIPRDTIEARKRKFMAALALQDETRLSWATKHNLDQSDVSKILAGKRGNARILGLIYQEIEKAWGTLMGDVE